MKMNKKLRYLLSVALAVSVCSLPAQPGPEKLQQWKDLKFSLFIHWGIYSELGGVWDGKHIERGLSEQIQAHAGIYSDTYAAVAKRFNPTHWNADSIVLLAKAAGMRSVIITSKHHDGFCMFKSAYTRFNVVDATPFKRDVLKELSTACVKHGLQFGIYFSLIDWHYPQASPISSHNSDFITAEHHEYNKKQVTELLTNYGAVSEIWFDMGSQSRAQSKELSDLVHQYQPDCMVSSRIGNDAGDFIVMGDNQEPNYSIGVPWQSPASFFDETWGYRSWQSRGSEKEKMMEKLASLIRVVSRGGNYLLNIGPKGDGSVVNFEKAVLLRIGHWLKENAEAIYGTQADPFRVAFDWGSITARPDRLYLHLLSTPADHLITLPGLKGSLDSVYFLHDHKPLNAIQTSNGINVRLPEHLAITDEYLVVVVKFKNGYSIAGKNSIAGSKKFTLDHSNAYKYYSSSCIDYNTRFRSTIKESWTVQSAQTNTYTPYAYYTGQEKGKIIDLMINNKETSTPLDGGEIIPIKNFQGCCTWQRPYLAGPFWSGLEGTEGGAKKIQTDKPWTTNGPEWQLLTDWKDGKSYELPATMNTAYYLLQEVVAKNDQPVLVNISSGDGLVVFVNGQEQYIHLNTTREKTTNHTVLIKLKKGENQVLMKFFSNFQETVTFSFNAAPEQILYRKKLEPVILKQQPANEISIKLHQPQSQHQDMMLPNLSLEFIK